MGNYLLDELSELLNCKKNRLHDHLKFPGTREAIAEHLKNKILRTVFITYDGTLKVFYFQQFSTYDAINLKPYKNMTIYQYYLKYYKSALSYPKLPCVIDLTNGVEFYPIELLEIIDADYIAYMI